MELLIYAQTYQTAELRVEKIRLIQYIRESVQYLENFLRAKLLLGELTQLEQSTQQAQPAQAQAQANPNLKQIIKQAPIRIGQSQSISQPTSNISELVHTDSEDSDLSHSLTLSQCQSHSSAELPDHDHHELLPDADLTHFLHIMRGHTTPWKVFIFGSESWGTSCLASDIDVAISLHFGHSRWTKKYLLQHLSALLTANDREGVLKITTILNAKCPIIRIQHHALAAVSVDISIADRFCLKRKRLMISLISHFESRLKLPVRKLMIFTKIWSKNRGINDAFGGYLNSFGFALLIVKFLQCTHGRDIPRNKHILSYNHAKALRTLLFEFFVFFLFDFDLETRAVAVTAESAAVYTQKQKHRQKQKRESVLEIVDPANGRNNVGAQVEHEQWLHIKSEFVRSFLILRKEALAEAEAAMSAMALFRLLTAIPSYHHVLDEDEMSDLDSLESWDELEELQQKEQGECEGDLLYICQPFEH